jgi:hypothetical protein
MEDRQEGGAATWEGYPYHRKMNSETCPHLRWERELCPGVTGQRQGFGYSLAVRYYQREVKEPLDRGSIQMDLIYSVHMEPQVVAPADTERLRLSPSDRKMRYYQREVKEPLDRASVQMDLIYSVHMEPRVVAPADKERLRLSPSDRKSPPVVLGIPVEGNIPEEAPGTAGICNLVQVVGRHLARHKPRYRLEGRMQSMNPLVKDTATVQQEAGPIADKGCLISRRDTVSFLSACAWGCSWEWW